MQPPTTVAIETSEEEDEEEPEEADDEKDDRDGLPFFTGDWLTSLSVDRPLLSSKISVVPVAGDGGMGEEEVVDVGVLLD